MYYSSNIMKTMKLIEVDRLIKTDNELINYQVMEYFHLLHNNNLPVSGPMLQEAALIINKLNLKPLMGG